MQSTAALNLPASPGARNDPSRPANAGAGNGWPRKTAPLSSLKNCERSSQDAVAMPSKTPSAVRRGLAAVFNNQRGTALTTPACATAFRPRRPRLPGTSPARRSLRRREWQSFKLRASVSAAGRRRMVSIIAVPRMGRTPRWTRRS